jgi:hypothetical protein
MWMLRNVVPRNRLRAAGRAPPGGVRRVGRRGRPARKRDSRQLLTNGLKAAVGAGVAGSEASEVWNFAKSMRLDGLPGLATPPWLEPPELALYELPRTGRWTAVVLDSDAREWLEEVWARENATVAGALGHLEAWLVPRGECEHGSESVAVHLGGDESERSPLPHWTCSKTGSRMQRPRA